MPYLSAGGFAKFAQANLPFKNAAKTVTEGMGRTSNIGRARILAMREHAERGFSFAAPPKAARAFEGAGARSHTWRDAGRAFVGGMKKWGFKDGGFSEQAFKTIGGNMARGAGYGVTGHAAYGIAGLAAPDNFEQKGSMFSSAARGAAYGAVLGGMGAIGGGITAKVGKNASRFTGKYKWIDQTGSMMKKTSESWAVRGALSMAAAGGAGNFSLTRPVNKGY